MHFKVFLGGLSGLAGEKEIKEYFSTFGTVLKLEIPKNSKSHKYCKGYGILGMAEKEAANTIIEQKTHRVNGRIIHCRPFLKGPKLKDQTQKLHSSKVFITEMPTWMKNDDMSRCFTKFGPIVDAYTIKDLETGESRGYGYVLFEQQKSAKKALKAKAVKIKSGEILIVKPLKDRNPRRIKQKQLKNESSDKDEEIEQEPKKNASLDDGAWQPLRERKVQKLAKWKVNPEQLDVSNKLTFVNEHANFRTYQEVRNCRASGLANFHYLNKKLESLMLLKPTQKDYHFQRDMPKHMDEYNLYFRCFRQFKPLNPKLLFKDLYEY